MKIATIDKNNLCLGCGICESILGKDSAVMSLGEDGFFHPNITELDINKQKIISKVCPGTNIKNDNKFNLRNSIWGKIDGLFTGYSTDSEIRERGSSGGVISAIGIYLLENKLVDGILQVGADPKNYKKNKLRISRSRNDVLSCASSRYAPALIFNDIIEILNRNEKFCFIGKPCDVAALNNLLREYPKYSDKILYKIAFFCAGMPSFKGTEKTIEQLSTIEDVENLYYRGNGWPGYFSFNDSCGREFKMTYNESWGEVLGRHIHHRCKLCPDGIGLQADVVMGDAWETIDGYPDFTEKNGQSLIIVRNHKGISLIEDMENSGRIKTQQLLIESLKKMQPSQYDRRKIVLARLGALLIKKRIMLNFKNMKLFYNLLSIDPRRIFNQFRGTIKRIE